MSNIQDGREKMNDELILVFIFAVPYVALDMRARQEGNKGPRVVDPLSAETRMACMPTKGTNKKLDNCNSGRTVESSSSTKRRPTKRGDRTR